MGRDKALLPYRGIALAEWIARAVEAAAGSATLVGSPLVSQQLQRPGISDDHPEQGPLGGIVAALRHSTAEWNLITACDMPGLSADFLTRLLELAETSGANALIPIGPSGWPEPLCAVYHRGAGPLLAAAFERGVRKVMAAAEETSPLLIPVPEIAVFENVNTPEEWAAHGG